MLGFDSRTIRLMETEDMLHLKLEYDMEVEEEHLAECTLTMKVRSKGTKGTKGNDRIKLKEKDEFRYAPIGVFDSGVGD